MIASLVCVYDNRNIHKPLLCIIHVEKTNLNVTVASLWHFGHCMALIFDGNSKCVAHL